MDVVASIGSTNQIKISALKTALEDFFGKVEIISINTESGVRDQPIGIDETKQGAINRMNRSMIDNESIFFVGIENGLVHGSTIGASQNHWYDLGICAITMMREGKSMTQIKLAAPLLIPNSDLDAPENDFKIDVDHLNHYREIIRPLIANDIDLYEWYSGGKMSRQSVLFEACRSAILELISN